MPTYDYKCSNCDYIFEYFQPMSAEPLTECPKCKGSLKRIIGAGAGPIFKGSGFYHTDYKGNKSKNNKSNKPETKPADSDKNSSKDDKK